MYKAIYGQADGHNGWYYVKTDGFKGNEYLDKVK